MTKLQTRYSPEPTQLREFYLCGIRTGYGSLRQANKAAQAWDKHIAYDCEYCPGVHHVKEDALKSDEKLDLYASEHWSKLLERLQAKNNSSQIL